MSDTDEERKFEPDPITISYINYLYKYPITFDKVKHLLDENNETTYTTENNVKPIYTADMLRDYRSELVEYIHEIHKSPSLEERWENAVKELLNKMENGKKI